MDFEKKGGNFRWHIFAFLRPPIHPTAACPLVRHRADNGSEIKNRASVTPPPSRRCHGFCFRWFLDGAVTRGALAPERCRNPIPIRLNGTRARNCQ